jgi:putative oxidoreductase
MKDHRELLSDAGLLILRVGIAGMMLTHGWPKLEKLMNPPFKFADPLGLGAEASLVLAVFAELFCSLLVVVGLGTRAAAIPLLITMLVAAFIVHGDDPWKKQEFALVYAIPFLTLIFTGPGRFSLDTIVRRKFEDRQ